MALSTIWPRPVRSREGSGQRIADRDAGARGRVGRIARHVAHAAHGLADRAVAGLLRVGPGLSVTGDTDHDEAWIDGAEHVVAQPPLLHRAGAEVLDEDVGPSDEPLDQGLTLRLPGIDLDRLLVAGDHRPPQRLPMRLLATPFPHGVAGTRLLDLDHLGAEIGQQLRAERPCNELPHLEHAKIGERRPVVGITHHVRCPPRRSHCRSFYPAGLPAETSPVACAMEAAPGTNPAGEGVRTPAPWTAAPFAD
jgi:hypothetical protein